MSDLAWMQEEATTFLLVAAVVRFFCCTPDFRVNGVTTNENAWSAEVESVDRD